MLDLGCSGGQLVADFRSVGWDAVGLEGSDFSLKHRRANWKTLANVSLFTCDIAKPFRLTLDGDAALFDLVTAWEVLEHIPEAGLHVLFSNILEHLRPGGLFIASTSSNPDVHDGNDLHVTKMSNQEWYSWIARHVPRLVPADLSLTKAECVRYEGQSVLVFAKASGDQTDSEA